MRQLTPRVYGILKYGSLLNAYLIRNGPALTLVDTGVAGFVDEIHIALKALGAGWSDVKHIVLTHAHIDHAGDLASVQRLTHAPTLAHRLDAPIARGTEPVVQPPAGSLSLPVRLMSLAGSGPFAPARIDRELNGGETLDDIAPGAQIIALPGHTHGQIGVWLPDEGTLIGGDVMANLPLQGLGLPFRAFTVDWSLAKQTIKQVAQMDVQNLMIGHGAPLIGDAAAKIRALAARL